MYLPLTQMIIELLMQALRLESQDNTEKNLRKWNFSSTPQQGPSHVTSRLYQKISKKLINYI